MKKKSKDFKFGLSIAIILFLIIYIFILNRNDKIDEDYKKIGLESYDVKYYTVYEEKDSTGQYKVYKLNTTEKKVEIVKRLEESKYWSKSKFYEYIMMRFYEMVDNNVVNIDREDLYYYHNNKVYAIFDVKNAKLYYFENSIWNQYKNYNNILGVNIENYNNQEIYSVRGGPQNDGLDYYVYEFSNECGQNITKNLSKNSKWSKNRLDDKILNNFIYNKEILEMKNGYYYYELVCRTRDENKKKNITKENATGCEIGIYDVEKNILYYYWRSI